MAGNAIIEAMSIRLRMGDRNDKQLRGKLPCALERKPEKAGR